MTHIRVGVFMGGKSREREVSFAGGRTVFDNLDRSIFVPIPIFVDSRNSLILLDWPNLYKGTIRDFFPPASAYSHLSASFQYYVEHLATLQGEEYERAITEVGSRISLESLPNLIDCAFLALHGHFGEDGTIQGLLDWLKIPYTGSGILGCAIGIDKRIQPVLTYSLRMPINESLIITWKEYSQNPVKILEDINLYVSYPCVTKPPTQGSSIGTRVVQKPLQIREAILASFFKVEVDLVVWNSLTNEECYEQITQWVDLRTGLGLPLRDTVTQTLIYTPEELFYYLHSQAKQRESLILEALDSSDSIIVEKFLNGEEFSVIVIAGSNGEPIALPPTQIIKSGTLFDYRGKYLPGPTRKKTPADFPDESLSEIMQGAERLMTGMNFDVYARIDGFLLPDGRILFNDPNTTSGMMPSSFFFHQAAEIGLDPVHFLTFVIWESMRARVREAKNLLPATTVLTNLQQTLNKQKELKVQRATVGVILGGYSTERHISVESGRNIYEKLSSSGKYTPVPVFLLHNKYLSAELRTQLNIPNEPEFSLWRIPLAYLLKDNADDIRDKIIHSLKNPNENPIIKQVRQRLASIREMLNGEETTLPSYIPLNQLDNHISFAFIALHGRPGEDGTVQTFLSNLAIPYNGSCAATAALTINKFETIELLSKAGLNNQFKHTLFTRSEWKQDPEKAYLRIEKIFSYPFIAKPVDDGCSSAVRKINSRNDIENYTKVAFRDTEEIHPDLAAALTLKPNEEFPAKDTFLIEEFIGRNEQLKHFLEVTVGLLTHFGSNGKRVYEIFEPSETLAGSGILSLEEKFLAGEGQNITPARFSQEPELNRRLSQKVREKIEYVAKLLDIDGYARIDAFVKIYENNKIEVSIIEVNSLPGMTPATCIFHQAALKGYTPFQMIDKIITYGFKIASIGANNQAKV